MPTVIPERDAGTRDGTSAFTGATCSARGESDVSYPVASVRCLLLERRVKMGKVKLAVFATLLAAGVLATAALASTKTSTVAQKSTAVGKVLVGANGRTLYVFTADKGKKSVCYGQCATYWPPLIAGKPTAGAGLNASMLGTTKRKDGKLQVTYHGHPLYFFLLDKKVGDVKGQGYVHFGGAWWVLSAAGAKVTTKP
jgi:predicted lipoprotein with Yx(FWY)xxD motif